MGTKLCSCELCFNENQETSLRQPQNTKTTSQNNPITNNDNSKSSLNLSNNNLKRNSSSSTHFQDTVYIDKRIKEILIKNQAKKIAHCYKRHHNLKQATATATVKAKQNTSTQLDNNPQVSSYQINKSNYIKDVGESSALTSSIGQKANKEEVVKPNQSNVFYGSNCSFKGSVTDLKKIDLQAIESKHEGIEVNNRYYNNMKDNDEERDDEKKKKKNNDEEKLTKDDIMQLMGMFGGNDEDCYQNQSEEESDNDNLSLE